MLLWQVGLLFQLYVKRPTVSQVGRLYPMPCVFLFLGLLSAARPRADVPVGDDMQLQRSPAVVHPGYLLEALTSE